MEGVQDSLIEIASITNTSPSEIPLQDSIAIEVQSTTAAQLPPDSDRRNRSEVWNHFKKIKNSDGIEISPTQAKCNYCPKVYRSNAKIGTSSMRAHMLYQCKKCPIYLANKRQKILSFDSLENGAKLVCVEYNKDVSRLYCIRMIIRDELPFSFIKGQGYIEFMRITQPKFNIPSRRTIARGVWELYLEEKNNLKCALLNNSQCVSLTTDTWTSIQNVNYMVLTAHFIDDNWTLHKRILKFLVIANHKGKTIGKLMENCLIYWGIEKVFTIVVDNASANQVAVDYIRDKIGNWKTLVLNGSFLHMRCCCHILNLIVKDGMDELDSAIDGIRNCVKYTRSSPSRLAKFRSCAAQEKIEHKGGIVPLDVCTRWNSTYFMLDIALKYRYAISRLEDEDSQFEGYFQEKIGGKKREGPPKNDDWDKAARLVKFLKIFYDATLKFSGTKFVTTNEPLLWMSTIMGELDKCVESDDLLLMSIGNSMKKKFDKYWLRLHDMNKILVIAVVLDPRYKMLYLEYFFPCIEPNPIMVKLMVDEIKSMFLDLYYEYCDLDPVGRQASLDATMPKIDHTVIVNCEEDSHAANMQKFMRLRQERDVVVIKNEVDKYLVDASEDPSNKNFELLQWWKENTHRNPILSKIAKDVFVVLASTVASETAFSLDARVVDPFRASLTPKMVEALVCANDWLKADGFSFYKDPAKDEIELYEELENVEKGV